MYLDLVGMCDVELAGALWLMWLQVLRLLGQPACPCKSSHTLGKVHVWLF